MKNKKSKTAILYCRSNLNSKREGNKQISSQLKILTEYCEKNDIPVAYIAKEYASGTFKERPELGIIVKLIESGKLQSGILLVTSWCRFGRESGNAVKLKEHLSSHEVTVLAADKNTSEPTMEERSQKLSESISFLFSKYDMQLRSDKIKSGIAAARARRNQQ